MMALLMRVSTLLALILLGTAQAHTLFTTLFVDGVNQGDGVCIRMNNDPAKATYPVRPVTSRDIACGKLSVFLTTSFRVYATGSVNCRSNVSQVSMAKLPSPGFVPLRHLRR